MDRNVWQNEAAKLLTGSVFAFAVGLLAVRVRRLMSFIKNLREAASVMASPTFMAMPAAVESIVATVALLDGRLKRVEYQIGPNGGGSIYDGVKRIEARIEAINCKERELVDAAGVLMWASDDEGSATWTSRALQRLSGWDGSGLIGANWVNLFGPDDLPEVRLRWRASIENQEPFAMRTFVKVRDKADRVPVSLRATRLPDGTYLGTVIDLREI